MSSLYQGYGRWRQGAIYYVSKGLLWYYEKISDNFLLTHFIGISYSINLLFCQE